MNSICNPKDSLFTKQINPQHNFQLCDLRLRKKKMGKEWVKSINYKVKDPSYCQHYKQRN